MQTAAHPSTPIARPRSRSRLIVWILVAAGVILLAAYFGISGLVTDSLTRPKRQILGADPASHGVAFEAVTFPSRTEPALTLSAWFLPDANSSRAIIVVHGYGSGGCRTCGFNGHFGEFGPALQQRGFNVLMMDLRGHGQSGDGRYTFGLREKHDVEGAVDWLLAKGFKSGQIGVMAESMGGATSVYATAEEPAIGALVLDSVFADLDKVLQKEFPRASGLPGFFLPGAYLMGRVLTGVDLSTDRPAAVIGQIAPRPLLLIQGTQDELLGMEHVQMLSAAAPSAKVWIVDGATHVDAYATDPGKYLDTISDFFSAGLK